MYLFQVVCTSSRFFLNLYVPYPGCFLIWLSRDALPSCFYSSRSFSRLLWFLMYLFQVVCTSSRFFLNLYVPHVGCFLINPGSFWICLVTCSTSSGLFYDRSGFFLDLSWYLPYLVGVLFWSIRVLSNLVLVLAPPCRGSFLSIRFLSGLALRSVFFLISWYGCSSPACYT